MPGSALPLPYPSRFITLFLMTSPQVSHPIALQPREHGLGPWVIVVSLAEVRGRLECVGLDVQTSRPLKPTPLTASAYRALPLGEIVKAAKRKLLRDAGPLGGDVGLEKLKEKAQRELGRRDKSLGGAPGRPPEHFAEVADEYAKAWREGRPPVQAVAAWGGVSRSAAAKWVYRARQLGLLAPTTKGRPSGRIVHGRASFAGSGEMKAKATVRKSKKRKAREAE
jgi:hypothetical protein